MKLKARQLHVSIVQHEDGEELRYFKQKTYCGAKPEACMFQGAGHAILAISNQSYTQPCPECVKAIQTITEGYLKENSND
jgi:hypothetical protein